MCKLRDDTMSQAGELPKGMTMENEGQSSGAVRSEVVAFDFHAHLARQAAWSSATFGPGPRTLGVCDHIRKELLEIEADPLDLKEWIDVVILALDGAWRCGGTPAQIIDGIVAKQAKNEGRNWPDWRTMDPDKAIEHDRSKDSPRAADAPSEPSEPIKPPAALDTREQLIWMMGRNSSNDLLEVARTLCSIAARRQELTDSQRVNYPHVDEEGSPVLCAARAACVARGYTKDGLSVEGVVYPLATDASSEPSELVKELRECAGNSGYSHNDYADTMRRAADALDNLAPAAPAARAWQPIETAPRTGRTVMLGCFNSMGNWRTMRGQWFTKEEIDQEWEETDGFEAGWYETAEVPDCPNCWPISPTHWAPTPPAPQQERREAGNADQT